MPANDPRTIPILDPRGEPIGSLELSEALDEALAEDRITYSVATRVGPAGIRRTMGIQLLAKLAAPAD